VAGRGVMTQKPLFTPLNSTIRKNAARRSLRNPIRCFDQAAIRLDFFGK
jgi:hypothetical protein